MSTRIWIDIYEQTMDAETDTPLASYQLFGNYDFPEELQNIVEKHTAVNEDYEFSFEINDAILNEIYFACDKACIRMNKDHPLTISIEKLAKPYIDTNRSMGEALLDIIDGNYYPLISAHFLKWLMDSRYISGILPGHFSIKEKYKIVFSRY